MPASLALKHRPTRSNGRLPGLSAQAIDLVDHARTAGTTSHGSGDDAPCDDRHTSYGAVWSLRGATSRPP